MISCLQKEARVTKADRLAAVLDDLLAVSVDAEAAAVVSADGLPMASALPPHVEEDRLAAMSAAILTLGERAAEGLGRGDLAQVFVEGEDGYIVLMAAGPHAVLVTITNKKAKVGLVLFEMKKAAAGISDVMNEGSPSSMHEDGAYEVARTEGFTPPQPSVSEPSVPAEPDPVGQSIAGWQ
jgi:uncharacterized protein